MGAEPRAERIMLHPGLEDRRTHAVAHHQRFDRDSFFGRVWSSSYVKHGVADRAAFDEALGRLFDQWSEDGPDGEPGGNTVTFDYLATAVSFR